MRRWLCFFLVLGMMCGVNHLNRGSWENVWWGVMDETALEMAGAEKTDQEEKDPESVQFYFPWLEALLECIQA